MKDRGTQRTVTGARADRRFGSLDGAAAGERSGSPGWLSDCLSDFLRLRQRMLTDASVGLLGQPPDAVQGRSGHRSAYKRGISPLTTVIRAAMMMAWALVTLGRGRVCLEGLVHVPSWPTTPAGQAPAQVRPWLEPASAC